MDERDIEWLDGVVVEDVAIARAHAFAHELSARAAEGAQMLEPEGEDEAADLEHDDGAA